MHHQIRRRQFDRHREPAQPTHQAARRVPFGVVGKRPVFLHQLHRLGLGQRPQSDPPGVHRRGQARGHEQVQSRAVAGEVVRLARGHQGGVGDVVQHQQDGAVALQPVREAAGDGGEEAVRRLALLVADGGAEGAEIAQRQCGLADARLALARHVQAAAGVDVGVGVRVGEGQLGLADAAQALHAADDAGTVVLQARAQVHQFGQPSGELAVVGRDGVGALGPDADALGPLLHGFGKRGQHLAQVFGEEEPHALLVEGLDGDELAAAQVVEVGGLPDAGDLLLQRLGGVLEAGHGNDVDRGGTVGKNVLGDFGVDPLAPFAAAPFALQVFGGEEGDEHAGVGHTVEDAVLPVVAGLDVVLVEEDAEVGAAGEGTVFGAEVFDEVGDPVGRVVGAGVGDEDVEAVRVVRHTGDVLEYSRFGWFIPRGARERVRASNT